MEETKLIETILELINKVPYGSVNFTVYRHGNKTVNLVVNEYENAVFENNVEFMEWLLNGLKKAADMKQSGPINLSITLKNGQFSKITETRQKQFSGGGEKDAK